MSTDVANTHMLTPWTPTHILTWIDNARTVHTVTLELDHATGWARTFGEAQIGSRGVWTCDNGTWMRLGVSGIRSMRVTDLKGWNPVDVAEVGDWERFAWSDEQ